MVLGSKNTLKISVLLATVAALAAYPLFYQATRLNNSKIALFSGPALESDIKAELSQLQTTQKTVLETVCQELDQKHHQLVQALIEAFPLPGNAWQACQEELKKVKLSDNLLLADADPIPTDNLDQIDEISTLFYASGVNPKRVTIIPTQNNAYFVSAGQGIDDAGTVVHELRINFEKLHKKSPEIQQAIIAHELQHLLQYDCLELTFISGLLQDHGISANQLYTHPAFIAYKRHIEYRADLKAAAQDLHIAHAFAQDFQESLEQHPQKGQKQFSSHPSKKDRLQAMSNLIAYLESEKERASA